jgi:type I restriction-modification system DNA methylase subunit
MPDSNMFVLNRLCRSKIAYKNATNKKNIMAKTAKTEQEEPLEKKLWKAADKLRKNMDAAEYKHVALGLI